MADPPTSKKPSALAPKWNKPSYIRLSRINTNKNAPKPTIAQLLFNKN